MTINVKGPDGSNFAFPDGTPEDTINGALSQHYGAPQAATVPPTTVGRVASELARGVPVLGPAITNRIGSQQDREAWEAAHPWLSTGLQTAGGAAAFALAPEAEAAALGTRFLPQALGMTGRLAAAVPRAAASGAAINAADALARGEDPEAAATMGALGGAGGAALGRGAGLAWDAARNMWRPQAAVQRYLPRTVAGVQVPASESVMATAAGQPDVVAARAEDIARKTEGPGRDIAVAHDAAANQAMQQAHANLSNQINPAGSLPGTTQQPFAPADAAVGDLVSQEQARAHAEVARLAGLQQQQAGLRTQFGGGAAPMGTADVGDVVSQGIANRFDQARANRAAAYQDYANVPGEFNARHLLNMGERAIRPALDNPTSVGLPRSERVYVKPDLMPQTSGALDDIDHEMGQLALTNDVARGTRPITSADIEEVRKLLIQRQQAANQAARTTGNWQDVRGMRRLMQEFDRHMLDVVTRPGGFSGDAQAYMDAQAAARQSHATMQRLFARQGAGDKVGTFMEGVLGRYEGQEMSPDNIVRKLMGTPDRPAPAADAVPILAHLRDNVFGANSPEWRAIKQGVVGHLADERPGQGPLSLTDIADRIDNFLGNERHSGAILEPGERAQLQNHANALRAEAAQNVPPAASTIDRTIAQISGRGGVDPKTGEQVMGMLFRPGGDQLASALESRLPRDTYNRIRQAVWREISEAPEGKMPWGDQKTGQSIADFLNTPLAHRMFNANELQVMRDIAQTHLYRVPPPGAVNLSGTAYAGQAMLKGMKGQLLRMIAAYTGHIPGWLAAEGAAKVGENLATRRAAERATQMFVGPRPLRAPVALPQRIGATAGRLLTPPRRTRQEAAG